VLGFRVDADGPAGFFRLALGQRDDFFQRGDVELAVELLWTFG
jgi:hypothetical protein